MTKTIDIHAADASTQDIIAMMADVDIVAAESGRTGPRAFKVNAYNGGALRVRGYDLPVVIDLKGMSFAKSITANLHHDQTLIVGHFTEKTNDGASIHLGGVVSGTGAAANEFLATGDNGYPWQASVEVNPTGRPVEVKAGKSVEVNGQTFEGPLYIARKSKLYGVAMLPRGADESTSVKIAAEADDNTKGKTMNPEFAKWIVALGFDPADITDKQKAALQAKYDAEIKAAADDPTEEGGEEGDSTGEKTRNNLADIRAAFDDHMVDIDMKLAEHEEDFHDPVRRKAFAAIKASAISAARELKKKAIKENWQATRFEVEAIKAAAKVELDLVKAERPQGPAIHASQKDVTGDVIEAALCMSLKTPNIEKQFKEETLDAANKHFKRFGLKQAIIMAAAINGRSFAPGESISTGNLKEVLRYAFPQIEAGGSTVSLPGVFANVANKELLAGYEEEDQTWREIAQIKTVNDFKTATSYRLLDNMQYEELGADGKIKHGTLGEESYTRQAKTYAKMFALTRTQIINDDLSAFDDLRNRLGRGAAAKFNDIFWAKFLDNSSFFTSGLTNYISGGTTNLGTDGVGLGLGVKAFRLMTSPTADGVKRIGGMPTILLVPPELESIAEGLYRNQNLGAVANSSANIYANKYRPVIVPWLSDSAFTGYSTTAWYLFRAPTSLAPMVVSFLDGQQTPTVESADADFDELGVQFRGYHDWGCDQAEYLAGLKSKGAA